MEKEVLKNREKESAATEESAGLPQPLEDEAAGAASGGKALEPLWYTKHQKGQKMEENP